MTLFFDTCYPLALERRMALLFEEHTRILRGCLFDVHNEVGIGYPEEAYHRALKLCCERKGIPLLSKQKGRLEHRDRLVHTFEYDLLALNEIMLELKTLAGGFARENYVQLLSYLKFWHKQLGLLENLGLAARWQRMPLFAKLADACMFGKRPPLIALIASPLTPDKRPVLGGEAVPVTINTTVYGRIPRAWLENAHRTHGSPATSTSTKSKQT